MSLPSCANIGPITWPASLALPEASRSRRTSAARASEAVAEGAAAGDGSGAACGSAASTATAYSAASAIMGSLLTGTLPRFSRAPAPETRYGRASARASSTTAARMSAPPAAREGVTPSPRKITARSSVNAGSSVE